MTRKPRLPDTKDRCDPYQINPDEANHSAPRGYKTRITRMSRI